ncbi:hypothetical protein Zmor_000166 [Zophobas morio]|mgnify:FL=1|uniref:Uncharacterized protein n=1 Tax=Zophobas morio TaxID=2755281 RepID=A0AA38MQZ7_9CUCU|nr:hypothetical protein Zmor_000166 [Zophobas morio]
MLLRPELALFITRFSTLHYLIISVQTRNYSDGMDWVVFLGLLGLDDRVNALHDGDVELISAGKYVEEAIKSCITGYGTNGRNECHFVYFLPLFMTKMSVNVGRSGNLKI